MVAWLRGCLVAWLRDWLWRLLQLANEPDVRQGIGIGAFLVGCLSVGSAWSLRCAKTPLRAILIPKTIFFTKTGSGQPQGRLEKQRCFCVGTRGSPPMPRRGSVRWRQRRRRYELRLFRYENASFAPLYTKNDLFAKTGSGQP